MQARLVICSLLLRLAAADPGNGVNDFLITKLREQLPSARSLLEQTLSTVGGLSGSQGYRQLLMPLFELQRFKVSNNEAALMSIEGQVEARQKDEGSEFLRLSRLLNSLKNIHKNLTEVAREVGVGWL